MNYTISEAANYLHTTPSALRYYEKEGLLPFVKRSQGGKRVFDESDFEWLLIINCLKRTGLSIKQIREFAVLVRQGYKTISQRKRLFYRQREEVEKHIADLRKNLALLQYKCWFYETAEKAGTTAALSKLRQEDLPPRFRAVHKKLKDGRL